MHPDFLSPPEEEALELLKVNLTAAAEKITQMGMQTHQANHAMNALKRKMNQIGITSGTGPPRGAVAGQMYFNTENNFLYTYDGSSWHPQASDDPTPVEITFFILLEANSMRTGKVRPREVSMEKIAEICVQRGHIMYSAPLHGLINCTCGNSFNGFSWQDAYIEALDHAERVNQEAMRDLERFVQELKMEQGLT